MYLGTGKALEACAHFLKMVGAGMDHDTGDMNAAGVRRSGRRRSFEPKKLSPG
jgi:hypothetical protein